MTRKDTTPMRDVSHTNPYTGETFTTVYERGPAVTDGGETTSPEMTGGSETMEDVDHTPRDGDGANTVWERGYEDEDEVHEDEVETAGDVDE